MLNQGFDWGVLDVFLKFSHRYHIELLFVDLECLGRLQAIPLCEMGEVILQICVYVQFVYGQTINSIEREPTQPLIPIGVVQDTDCIIGFF